MKKSYLLGIIFLLMPFGARLFAQYTPVDSARRAWALSANYSYELPGADLAKRFGNNMAIGTTLSMKTKKNFNYTLQWTYIFGKDIRESGILDSIMTQDGHVIDKEGKYADVRMFERGFTLNASIGKIFTYPSAISVNPNSGLYLAGGIGMIQHKIKIYDNGGRTPQLTKEYLKGYDRSTNGFATNQFIGYWYMSKSRYVNFYAGFEFTEGFTMSRRSWDTDLMRQDTQHRIDLLWGGRIGWNILIAKRTSGKYYSY